MKGSFQTAGVRFWPEMEGLTPEFWKMVRMFRQVVPVFTNVVFDTSQKHANVVFDNMFEWLDSVKSLIEKNADTLFGIRAHPDELRPGKESLETVTDWIVGNHLTHLTNVLYIAPDQYFSSYEFNSDRQICYGLQFHHRFRSGGNGSGGFERRKIAIYAGTDYLFSAIETSFHSKSAGNAGRGRMGCSERISTKRTQILCIINSFIPHWIFPNFYP
jgi:hypothetical protein